MFVKQITIEVIVIFLIDDETKIPVSTTYQSGSFQSVAVVTSRPFVHSGDAVIVFLLLMLQ